MPAIAAESVTPARVMRPKQTFAVSPNRFQVSEYAYADFSATLPPGTKVEEILNPEAWVHVCHLLEKRPVTGEPELTGAIIAVRTEDHEFYLNLYVRAVPGKGLVVEILKPDANGVCWLGPRAVTGEPFDVKWNIGKRGFDIIRNSDREIVADGAEIKTKEAAQEWIDETMKVN